MKSSKPEAIKSRRNLRIRITGTVFLVIGLVGLGILLLNSAPLALILLAGVLIMIGILLTASPEAFVIVIEALTWIP